MKDMIDKMLKEVKDAKITLMKWERKILAQGGPKEVLHYLRSMRVKLAKCETKLLLTKMRLQLGITP
ncbi:hypothetical protein [Pyrococcus kukulkanii]|uniref:hypothetical protein n=1 Tax=Pyrococcus kukulkanii TaxID=1609559 RepID=UPI0035666846